MSYSDIIGQRTVSSVVEKSNEITSNMIRFVQKNVFSVTEMTRSNKLSEILESFSNRKSEDIYLVQNTRNRDAIGAIIDIELLEELLALREAFQRAVDEAVEMTAIERLPDFEATHSLAHALHGIGIDENDIDVDHILKLSDELEI